jgi:hypothetical protein
MPNSYLNPYMKTLTNERNFLHDMYSLVVFKPVKAAINTFNGYTSRHFILTLLLIALGLAVEVQAQQLKINFSSQAQITDDVTAFHQYGDYVYSNRKVEGKSQLAYGANLKKIKMGLEITKYDENLKVDKVLSIDNNAKDIGPFDPLVHYGEKAIYVLYCKYNDDNKIKFYAAKVNPEELSIIDTKELFEYDQENQAILKAIKTMEETQTFFTVSEDGKNAWILHAGPKLILSCVIDFDLNIVQKAESTPVKLEKLVVTATHIGNDGNKVVVYRYDNPADPEFYTRGLFFEPANKKGSFKTITFKGGFAPGNLAIHGSKNSRKLYLGGEYFGDDYSYGGKGVVLGEIDFATHSILTPKFFPYPDSIKQRVLNLGFASKKKGEIVFVDRHLNYRFDEMENGTIVLSSDVKGGGSTSNYTFTYHGPIIQAFIKPDGNVVMNLIPKKQVAGSATGFYNHIFKDKLICIYGDHPKFQEKEFPDDKIGLVRMPGAIVPVANIYDSNGKFISRKMLINDTKGLQGNVMIDNLSKIDDNRFLMPVGKVKVNMVKYYTSVSQVSYVEVLNSDE